MGIAIGKLRIFKQHREDKELFNLLRVGEMFRLGPFVGKLLLRTPWFYIMLQQN